MRKIILGVLAVIIIISLIVLAVVGASISGGGYRVTVNGKVTYDGFENWDVKYQSMDYDIDQSIFNLYPSWFWETDDVVVELMLWGKEKYTVEKNLGKVFALGGEKTFSLNLRHVEVGYYSAELRVYETKGGFFGFGADKNLRDSCSFNIDIESLYGN